MFRQILGGIAERAVARNHFAMQTLKAKLPTETKLEIASFQTKVQAQLKADPELQKQFNAVKLELPEGW